MPSLPPLRVVLPLVAAACTGLVAACARQGAPPGGPEDRRPPVVTSTDPEPFAVLTERFRGPVRFHFDERVSERVSAGTLDDAVLVSPRTGDVRVGHGRRDISVELSGGFKPGMVYRVTLLPVIRDLFNNQMRDPFELVFSTGGELNPSAVAGVVWDRATGAPMPDIDVLAVAVNEDGDSTVYVARTDTGGVYVLRYLPPSRYELVAFEDRDRDNVVDRMEVQGRRSINLAGPDTSILPIGVLQPDTTPARLTRATPLDSVTLLLDFDDYLDPSVSAAQIGMSLSREDGESPGVEMVFHEPQYVAWRQAVQDSFIRLDSIQAAERAAQRRAQAVLAALAARDTASQAARDTARDAARDTAQAEPDSLGVQAGARAEGGAPLDTAQTVPQPAPPPVRALPPELPAGPPGSGAPDTRRGRGPGGGEGPPLNPDGQPLPARRVVVRLDGPLETSVPYQLTVTTVRNLNGLPLGGGEAAVLLEPPKDTTAAADSAAVDPMAPPDTAEVVPDSSVTPPDTTLVPPDTALVPPDTTLVPPDTGRVVGPRALFLPGRRW